jgi:hypothetical protein
VYVNPLTGYYENPVRTAPPAVTRRRVSTLRSRAGKADRRRVNTMDRREAVGAVVTVWVDMAVEAGAGAEVVATADGEGSSKGIAWPQF